MTPTDPQGAEGRETRTETKWRNVYEDGIVGAFDFPTLEALQQWNAFVGIGRQWPNIGYQCERIETTTTITRHPLGGTERE